MSLSTSIRTRLKPFVYLVGLPYHIGYGDAHFSNSADLEITVQMLVQVDKLVQLIESPVFTCELPTKHPQSMSNNTF